MWYELPPIAVIIFGVRSCPTLKYWPHCFPPCIWWWYQNQPQGQLLLPAVKQIPDSGNEGDPERPLRPISSLTDEETEAQCRSRIPPKSCSRICLGLESSSVQPQCSGHVLKSSLRKHQETFGSLQCRSCLQDPFPGPGGRPLLSCPAVHIPGCPAL